VANFHHDRTTPHRQTNFIEIILSKSSTRTLGHQMFAHTFLRLNRFASLTTTSNQSIRFKHSKIFKSASDAIKDIHDGATL
jgi:hypothetical protein